MELFSDLPGDEGLPGVRRRAMLAVMTATTMAVFDGTIINVALPQISLALQTSAAASVWVANAYLLATAMTLAAFAAMSSRLGFRNQFTAGLAVFTLASLGCALSPTVEWLIAMRVLQGLGARPCSALRRRSIARSFPTACWAASSAQCRAGGGRHRHRPGAGRHLLAALSWEWIFLINCRWAWLLLSWSAIPDTRQPVRAPPSTWPARCGRRWPWARSSWRPTPAHASPTPARAPRGAHRRGLCAGGAAGRLAFVRGQRRVPSRCCRWTSFPMRAFPWPR
jgi:DHA2 family multidrug resistance protein-like MFS transporter